MLGLFGALNLGSQSLATQRQGVEVAGHNLANVNNPAYARQRLAISTSPSVPSDIGPQGSGAEATNIVRLRSDLLDQEIQSEISVRASLESQQSAVADVEANLGQHLDSTATAAQGTTADVGSSHSLSDNLSQMFNDFQSLSSNPTSVVDRATVLQSAANLATQFHQLDSRLSQANDSLNQSVKDGTASANGVLAQIASLNEEIAKSEINFPGSANDLRDLRQSQIEDLAKIVKIDLTAGDNGAVNISVAGTQMVSGNKVTDHLEAFDTGSGQFGVRSLGTGTTLNITGGQIHGTMEARDGALADLRTGINSLAQNLIQQVNAVHSSGYSLTGSTGANFFDGTDAATIKVNDTLAGDPSLLQAASVSGAVGDNGVAVALAQLAQQKQPGLNNQTFSQSYSKTSTALGQAASSVNHQLSDQQLVEKMLIDRRDSVSGVSLDEEMTDLTRFQRAFQASAKLISTIDELLSSVINMKT